MAQDWNNLLEDPLFNMGAGLLAGAGTSNPWATALGHLNQYQQNRSLAEQRRLHSRLYEAQAQRAEEEMQLKQEAQRRQQAILDSIADPQERALAAADMGEWVKSKFAKRDPKVVGAGGSLVDPNTGQPIFTAPPTPEKQPEFVRMAQALRDPNVDPETKRLIAQRLQVMSTHAPGATVRVENYPQPMPAINPQTGRVELTQFGTQGTPKPTGFEPAPPAPPAPKEATFDEKKAAGFLARMERAESILQDPKLQADQVLPLGEATLRGAPLTGGKLAPYGMSQNRQLVRQAQEDWVRAKLRPESGAAIPNDEMEREIQLYFPQPGENSPAIIQQKAQARLQAVEQMRSMAGRAPVPANVDAAPSKTVVRRVRLKNGKTGIEYSDGTRSVE